ncbi:Major Facilitator Superfamily protein [uncultured archaeon]|nr:Major Facilitator Superfamily protein [uncultured archaeon]
MKIYNPMPEKTRQNEITEADKKRSLKYSIYDGSVWGIMTGFGDQYVTPFAVELGVSAFVIGLITSIPALFSSFAQLFNAAATDLLHSRKKVILVCVFLQALMWAPLALIPFIVPQEYVEPVILLSAIALLVFGGFGGPPWASIMGDLVPKETMGEFFGRRNRIVGAVTFTSILTAGFILDIFKTRGSALYGFSALFTVALIARLLSFYFLTKHVEMPYRSPKSAHFSFLQYLIKLPKTNYGHFAIYLALMNFSVNVAGPFFAVYMLRDLNLSYAEYTIVTVAVTITSFLTMTMWGRAADKFGNKHILNVTGMLLPLVPVVWLFGYSVSYLIVIQMLSGFVWAGFNLSTFNFIYENVRPTKRTRVTAYQNAINGGSIFVGGIIGGYLAIHITDPWIFKSPLQFLFLLSGILRLLISLLMLPRIQEVREVEEPRIPIIPWRLGLSRSNLGLRPIFYPIQTSQPVRNISRIIREAPEGVSKMIHEAPDEVSRIIRDAPEEALYRLKVRPKSDGKRKQTNRR